MSRNYSALLLFFYASVSCLQLAAAHSAATNNLRQAPPTLVTTACSQPVTFTPNDYGPGVQVIAVTTPTHGTASFLNNTITYTPNTGYSGTDSFSYTFQDTLSNIDTGVVNVTVTPVASPGSITTPCSQPITFTPTDCGTGVQITGTGTPAHGIATFTTTTITYTPLANYSGSDSFSYTITDSSGASDTGSIAVVVTPLASAATISTPCSQAVTFSPVVCGSGTVIIAVTTPTHGVTTFTSSSIKYTPITGYSGPDSFSYTIQDALGNVSTAAVTVTVTPVASPASITTNCSQPITFTPITCGSDTIIMGTSSPSHGSTGFTNTDITYTPTANYSGPDSFTYTITDDSGNSAIGLITVVVKPLAAATSITTPCSQALTFTPLVCGSGTTITAVTAPAHGTRTFTSSSITYTPTANYSGPDSFSYTVKDSTGNTSTAPVTVTVTPVANPASATTLCGNPVTITPTACGLGTTITSTTTPANGTATVTGSSITYTPGPDYSGPDTFNYTITDSAGSTNTATITLSVTPVALPTPIATNCSQPITFTPDECGSGIVITTLGPTSNGVATFTGNTITYTPNSGFSGPDDVTYIIRDSAGNESDSIVTIDILPVASPTSITTSCSGSVTFTPNECGAALSVTAVGAPAQGTASFSNNKITYTPTPGFSGSDSFTYTITDIVGNTASSFVTVTVAPTAQTVPVVATCGQTASFTPNLCGTGISIIAVNQPSHGVSSFSGNVISYTPDINYLGADSFTYTIQDSFGTTATGLVVITVGATNPITQLTTSCGTLIVVTPLECATGQTIVSVATPAHGTATFIGNSITYKPQGGFSGTDTITYTFTDGVTTGTGTITVTVNPVAGFTNLTLPCSTPITFTPNDCGSGLVITTLGTPLHGTAVATGNSVTYTPDTGFSGIDNFGYTITDSIGNTDSSTIRITVTPLANPTAITTPCGQALSFTPDECGSGIVITGVGRGVRGKATFSGNTLTYTPFVNVSGNDSFFYLIKDAIGNTANSRINVIITPVARITNVTTLCSTSTTFTPNKCGSGITVSAVGTPTNGTATFLGSTITYTPTPGFSGNDSFSYTITDSSGRTDSSTINVIVRPVALATPSTTLCSTAVTITPNECGSGITVTAVGNPTRGSATFLGNTVTYTPNTNFSGNDSFSYTITDSSGRTSSSTISVRVNPVAQLTSITTPCSTNRTFTPNECGTGITIASTGAPTRGTTTFTGNTITYRPTTGYSGPDSFSYTIRDSSGRTDSSTVSVIVTPVARATTVNTPCSTAVTFTPNGCGSGLSVTSLSTPLRGTASATGNTITYVPTTGYSGPDSFTYTVTDSSGRTATGTITVSVRPIARPTTIITACSTNTQFTPLECGTNITISAVGTPAHGTASFSGNTITYRPTTGYSGPDSFSYTIRDGSGNTSSSTITVQVTPTALPTSVITNCSTMLVFTPAECGTPSNFTITALSTPGYGTATVTGNSISYIPTPGYSGPDSFTYTITDTFGNSSTSTITIEVNPTATAESIVVTCQQATTFTPITCGTTVAITAVSTPAHGTASFTNNTITYTPDLNYNGPDSFTYTITDASGTTATATVSVTVLPVGQITDVTTQCSVPVSFTPLVCGSSTEIIAVTNPTHGTVSFTTTVITYRPVAGYSGLDSFQYTIRDTTNNTISTSTIGVTVTPVASPDSITTVCSQAASSTPPTCGTGISITAVGAATHGTTGISGAMLTYTPDAGFSGLDSFSYTIVDGAGNTDSSVVSVLVTPQALPTAVVTSCSQPVIFTPNECATGSTIISAGPATHGAVATTDTTISYTPTSGYSGPDNFSYTIRDAIGNTSTSTVTIEVNPTATAESIVVTCEQPTTFTPITCGTTVAITAVSAPSHGTTNFTSNSITYTPTSNYNGPDSFTYTITDEFGTTANATVSVTVLAVAKITAVTTQCSVPVSFTPLVCGSSTAILFVATPLHGTASFMGNTITYIPNTGYSGPDRFNYTIIDGAGRTSTSRIEVTVEPLAEPTNAATLCGQEISFTPNECGTGISITSVTGALHGTISFIGNTITYNPFDDFSGTDNFVYTIQDSSGNSSTSTGQVQVYPVAQPDSIVTDCSESLTFTPEECGTGITIIAAGPAIHGTVLFSTTTITYNPNGGYSGTDAFTYTIQDSSGAVSTATVIVQVNPAASPENLQVNCQQGATFVPVTCGTDTTITAVSAPLHGTASFTNNTITYTPDLNYNGPDSFTYTITDASGTTATATVSVTVLAVSQITDVSTQCSVPVSFTPLVCGSSTEIIAVTNPAHGTASFTSNTITYTPVAGYSGSDSFTYTIRDAENNSSTATITVTVTPVAFFGSSSTSCSQPVLITPQVCGTGISITAAGPATHGIVEFDDTTITYRPNRGYSGPDSFIYTILDSAGNSDSAAITIQVDPTAQETDAVTSCNQQVVFTPNDCGTGVTLIAAGPASNGTVNFADNSLTYIPNESYSGLDSFEYTIRDSFGTTRTSTATVLVKPKANLATILTACGQSAAVIPDTCGLNIAIVEVSTPAHGRATFTDTTITYTPFAGYSGQDRFEYTIQDSAGTRAVGQVTVTITPVAQPTNITTACSQPITFVPDSCGAGTTIISTGEALHGTVDFSGSTITYTPANGYSGSDSFTYTIRDTLGNTSTGIVSVTVTPVVLPESQVTACSTPLAFKPTTCGSAVSIESTTEPAHGTVSFTADTITYRPVAGYSGPDSFTCTIRDAAGATSTATITLLVTPVARPARATTTCSNQVVVTPVECGTTTRITATGTPAHGRVQIEGSNLLYTPDTNFSGRDSFSYTIVDATGTTDSSVVNIVTLPQANPVTTTVACGQAVTFIPNECGSKVTVTAVGKAAHGKVSFKANSITYTPTPGYSGPDAFSYAIRDAIGNTSNSTVTVLVKPKAPLVSVLAPCGQPITFRPEVCGTNCIFIGVGLAQHGSASFTETSISYTPDSNYAGPDRFTYTIQDKFGSTATGIVRVKVTSGSQTMGIVTECSTPITFNPDQCGTGITLLGVNQPAHGIASFTATSLTYKPNKGYSGPDSFSYTFKTETGAVRSATVQIMVKPVARVTTAKTSCNKPVSIQPAICGKSPLTSVGKPKHGKAEIINSTTVRYTPKSGFSGDDSFSYEVTNGKTTLRSTINVRVRATAECACKSAISKAILRKYCNS